MKVLLILVDGMRPDSFTNVPAAQKILARSAYNLNMQSIMPTVTLPCHLSLFYSVPPERHGTMGNAFTPWTQPMDGLCEVLNKNGRTCAMFYDWGALRDVARYNTTTHTYFASGKKLGREKACNMVTAAALDFLPKEHTDFAFLYYGVPDATGHEYGWMSQEYRKAIGFCWEHIHRVVETLGDEYTVMITADHGGHENTHGTALPEDMQIPLMVMGKDIPPGQAFAGANILDIAPTITKLLSVEPDPEWKGKSLL